MITYIRKSIPSYYVEFNYEIDSEYWKGKIGENYQDFLDNKWILLTDEQLQFHKENPNASIKQVLEMQLDPEYVRTLEEAKNQKKAEIEAYDMGENVNGFTINNSMTAWFNPDERVQYRQSVESATLLGVETLSFFIGDMEFTIPTESANHMLAAIHLYADECFIVTKKHKLAVEKLETIEEVDSYDYTVGYPEKLNFQLA